MIKKAAFDDRSVVAGLAILLWPAHTLKELEEEMGDYIASSKAAIFVAFEGKEPVGFAQCQLRTDYVEGTQSSPVGYLEGIFVKEECRKKGIARQLLTQCEEWVTMQGCKEFASDCELLNHDSLQFHLKVGFIEANRMICFTKGL